MAAESVSMAKAYRKYQQKKLAAWRHRRRHRLAAAAWQLSQKLKNNESGSENHRPKNSAAKSE
jgi:hypothetical protein